ncbi:hypothetical protein PR048_021975 [Dryococelus australis]|uniref:Uncharacterized protein n=1 Tax=Dryococelus australis TaxID=614101 RepID=A0ABQ9GZT3_9NEOP|nr:hypothetical protein PR048_021975 [Dryococelus australis]
MHKSRLSWRSRSWRRCPTRLPCAQLRLLSPHIAGYYVGDLMGTTTLLLTLCDYNITQDMYVENGQPMPLLGRPAIRALNFVPVREVPHK